VVSRVAVVGLRGGIPGTRINVKTRGFYNMGGDQNSKAATGKDGHNKNDFKIGNDRSRLILGWKSSDVLFSKTWVGTEDSWWKQSYK